MLVPRWESARGLFQMWRGPKRLAPRLGKGPVGRSWGNAGGGYASVSNQEGGAESRAPGGGWEEGWTLFPQSREMGQDWWGMVGGRGGESGANKVGEGPLTSSQTRAGSMLLVCT